MSERSSLDLFKRPVCLTLGGMEGVRIHADVPFTPSGNPERVLDLYLPPDEGPPTPVVLLVTGYAGLPYQRVGWTTSMCRLLAVSGIAAVAYTGREPVEDLRAVCDYVVRDGASQGLDGQRFGVLAVSGNAPTALSTLARAFQSPPTCAVFEYAAMLDLDGAAEVATAASQFGFANPMIDATIDDLRHDIPLLVVRAGRDEFTAMNASIDRFAAQALQRNMPLTLLNYPDGIHAFDLFDESRPARNAVRAVLRFFQDHLLPDIR